MRTFAARVKFLVVALDRTFITERPYHIGLDMTMAILFLYCPTKRLIVYEQSGKKVSLDQRPGRTGRKTPRVGAAGLPKLKLL